MEDFRIEMKEPGIASWRRKHAKQEWMEDPTGLGDTTRVEQGYIGTANLVRRFMEAGIVYDNWKKSVFDGQAL